MSAPRLPYPPLREWTWPKRGVRTWSAPAQSFFGACTGQPDCDSNASCPVGVVVTVNGGPYGCDCPCHAERLARAS